MFEGWIVAGQFGSTFWSQTPASFQTVLEGVRKKKKIELEDQIWLAHTIASMSAAAQMGKLKPLRHYQKAISNGGAKRQTPKEMLTVFEQLQKSGAPISIRRIERQ
jgi:hypothetical protein